MEPVTISLGWLIGVAVGVVAVVLILYISDAVGYERGMKEGLLKGFDEVKREAVDVRLATYYINPKNQKKNWRWLTPREVADNYAETVRLAKEHDTVSCEPVGCSCDNHGPCTPPPSKKETGKRIHGTYTPPKNELPPPPPAKE